MVEEAVAPENTVIVEDADESESVVSEYEAIQNPETKALAYKARKALRKDVEDQACSLISSHLGESFHQEQKERVSKLLLKCYDDPKQLFFAVKHANKGELKNKYFDITRVD